MLRRSLRKSSLTVITQSHEVFNLLIGDVGITLHPLSPLLSKPVEPSLEARNLDIHVCWLPASHLICFLSELLHKVPVAGEDGSDHGARPVFQDQLPHSYMTLDLDLDAVVQFLSRLHHVHPSKIQASNLDDGIGDDLDTELVEIVQRSRSAHVVISILAFQVLGVLQDQGGVPLYFNFLVWEERGQMDNGALYLKGKLFLTNLSQRRESLFQSIKVDHGSTSRAACPGRYYPPTLLRDQTTGASSYGRALASLATMPLVPPKRAEVN